MAYLIGTAGHVDHGKTTLVAALTGIDADRLPEEKARGMTIDLGFAFIDLAGLGRVSIVDVPGHERFIKNMLAGTSGVDVALLCVASDEGVMPQTKEHFEILRHLQATRIVVALTKCDATDKETQEVAQADVNDLLAPDPAYVGSPIVRVSAHAGLGLDELKEALSAGLRSLGPRALNDKDWFLPIDRVFSVAGHGTVVTGTLARGKARVGDEAVVMPEGQAVRIRGIQTHGESSTEAEAGQRTALNLVGAKKDTLGRGQAIGAPGALVETRCVNAHVSQFAKLRHGQRVRVHLGAGEFIAKAFLFDRAPGICQVRFETPVACAKGQRMVLRQYSPPVVLAGAEIVTPNAKMRRKGDKDIAGMAAVVEEPPKDLQTAVLAEIRKRPGGAATAIICETLGATPQALGEVFEKVKARGEAFGFAGTWVHQANFGKIAETVRAALLDSHSQAPQAAGIPKSRLLLLLGCEWEPKAFDRLIAKMAEDGLVQVSGAEVTHPDFQIQLNSKQSEFLERTIAAMNAAGAVAPSESELAAAVGAPVQAVREMVRLGLSVGRLTSVGDGFVYPKETLENIKATIRELPPRFTVAQFRDATGSSRKFALPLLQYFDETKFTRRLGDERIVQG